MVLMEHQDLRDLVDLQENQDHQEPQVLTDLQDLQENLDRLEPQVLMDLQDLQDLQVNQDQLEHRDHQD